MSIELPTGTLPVLDLTTQDVLYGGRTTRYRYELLAHNADGTDSLAGYLDGVQPGGTLQWAANSAVKGGGQLNVTDLSVAMAGMTRIGDVTLTTVRIRPVLVIDGLPEIPQGVYLVSKATEQWSDEGRVFQLQVLDRSTVLDQDATEEAFTATTDTPILTQVANLIATSGEKFVPDASDTRCLTAELVWDAGTSKLTIVNDLLSALGYSALTVSGQGDFQAKPYVVPASRSIAYELLNGIDRELVDGEEGIYQPDWSRELDSYDVPNKVIAVATGDGTTAPAVGEATNTDPTSPYSYAARGRWIVGVVSNVEVPTDTDPTTFLNAQARASLIASSSPQATVTVNHLPLPLSVNDVLRFASAPAGIDARHVATQLKLDLTPTGLMQSTLQQVVDL